MVQNLIPIPEYEAEHYTCKELSHVSHFPDAVLRLMPISTGGVISVLQNQTHPLEIALKG